jgi:hypothetical protein
MSETLAEYSIHRHSYPCDFDGRMLAVASVPTRQARSEVNVKVFSLERPEDGGRSERVEMLTLTNCDADKGAPAPRNFQLLRRPPLAYPAASAEAAAGEYLLAMVTGRGFNLVEVRALQCKEETPPITVINVGQDFCVQTLRNAEDGNGGMMTLVTLSSSRRRRSRGEIRLWNATDGSCLSVASLDPAASHFDMGLPYLVSLFERQYLYYNDDYGVHAVALADDTAEVKEEEEEEHEEDEEGIQLLKSSPPHSVF